VDPGGHRPDDPADRFRAGPGPAGVGGQRLLPRRPALPGHLPQHLVLRHAHPVRSRPARRLRPHDHGCEVAHAAAVQPHDPVRRRLPQRPLRPALAVGEPLADPGADLGGHVGHGSAGVPAPRTPSGRGAQTMATPAIVVDDVA
jgi:hypothetical protein